MSSVSPKISKKRSFHSFNEKRNEIRNDKGKSKSKKGEGVLEFDESYFDESEEHLQTKKAIMSPDDAPRKKPVTVGFFHAIWTGILLWYFSAQNMFLIVKIVMFVCSS